jgi:lipopolysaccharide/colanic/teichoic acid biosynthesis glycosyltransferase
MDIGETMLFATIAAGIFVALWWIYWLYELHKPIHNYYASFLKCRWWWIVLVSTLAYYWFWYLFIWWISRFVIVWWSWVVLLMITLWDMRWNALNTYLETKAPYRIALLYTNQNLSNAIKKVLWTYAIYQTTSTDVNEIKDLAHLDCYDGIIIAWTVSNEILQSHADHAKMRGQLFYFVNETHVIDDIIPIPTRMWPLLVLEFIASPLEGRWRVIKRLFDVLTATIALIALAPLFVIIAYAIKRDSPGPVLYAQKRVGKGNKTFTFYKFRSMYTHLSTWDQYGGDKAWELKERLINSDANVRPWVLSKIKDDPRVTKVWALLRKTSLDELPNLISVLLGTMSLIWPRPHEPHEVARYTWWQKRLFTVKPWITWYAQLFGRDELPFEEEARLDLRYIQNWSLLLDSYILITTIKVMLKGK